MTNSQKTGTADIGIIGLAVMGQNLALNMADHGLTVAITNRTLSKIDRFLATGASAPNIIRTYSNEELVQALKRPRRVMLMVKAGPAVDAVIEQIALLLEEGDIVIDGGNSHYADSTRRTRALEEKGLLFIGTGISGGEEGARHGPSIMPGGSPAAWPHVRPIFQAIAARADDGEPCCKWVGEEGAGHYVKMVHNGIEYGDMQLIAEAYDLMSHALGLTPPQMSDIFGRWNQGKLDSYLIEITANIMAFRDEDGEPLLNKILDSAGQKGTGKWTAIAALEEGIPLTLIAEAVFARFLSALMDERAAAAGTLGDNTSAYDGDHNSFIEQLGVALYAAKIISYSQGFMLLRAAADTYGWHMEFGEIASLWRAGCIIRAAFLDEVMQAFRRQPTLPNLLLDDYFGREVRTAEPAWRNIVARAVQMGIAVPALSSSLAFYDGYRRRRLPANLIQAQRDYFGAHTYERLDRPRGDFFHTDWTGEGGNVTASIYVG